MVESGKYDYQYRSLKQALGDEDPCDRTWDELVHEVRDLVALREVTVDDNIQPILLPDGKLEEMEFPTAAARVIFVDILPEWSEKFLAKNAHYGNTYESLGTAGQFADIWRKVGPLKKLLWDNKLSDWDPATGESAEDICNDLIGHLFLTLAMLKEGDENGS